jgi:predicted phosphodiesterase
MAAGVQTARSGRLTARKARMWVLRFVLVAALAVGGCLLGLRLAGPSVRSTALGTVSLRVDARWGGEVDAFIPIANWGVRADAFDGPLRLHVEPRSIDREALLATAGGDRSVLERAEKDASKAAHRAFLRALVWAVGGAFALGLAVAVAALMLGDHSLRHALGWLLAPAALAAVLSLGVLLRVEGTFHPEAFQNPSFYARGAELAQLLKVADKAQGSGEGYSNSVQRTLAGYATLLSAGTTPGAVGTEAPAIVVSDLHDNELVLGPLKRLFTGRPIFFVGDFGQRGTRAEARALIPQITSLGGPLVAVSGNHDSAFFMRRLVRAGVIVLTENGRLERDGGVDGKPVQRIAGVRMAGYADPLEWRGADPDDPKRIFSFAERPDGEEELARERRNVVRWFEGLDPRPGLVLVHQNALAQALAGTLQSRGYDRPLLILTGHDHKQHVDRYGQILVVDAGTVGAGGVYGVGQEAVGVAQLHLTAGLVLPRAVDLMRVEPLSGSASAERVVPDSPQACDGELVRCHDEEDR